MPVPKKRHSKTRKKKRQATWKIETPNVIKCPQCQAPVLPHHACANCGIYKGKTVIKIKDKKKEKAAKE